VEKEIVATHGDISRCFVFYMDMGIKLPWASFYLDVYWLSSNSFMYFHNNAMGRQEVEIGNEAGLIFIGNLIPIQ
jgi:hypothetical protein